SLVTFPLAFGMAVVADEFVSVVLGDKWLPASGPLAILAALTAVRSVVPLVSQVLTVTGGTRLAMLNGAICTLLAPLCFYVGTAWGIIGVAIGWWLLEPVTMVPAYRHVFRATGLSLSSYVWALWPALVGAGGMAAAVILLRYATPAAWPREVN